MQVALAKRPQLERPEPEGLLRENHDWIYAEFAGMPELRAIDTNVVAQDTPDAAPDEEEEDTDDHLLHPGADGAPTPPDPVPVFVPTQ